MTSITILSAHRDIWVCFIPFEDQWQYNVMEKKRQNADKTIQKFLF